MKNTTKRITAPNGDVVRIKTDLKVCLNYNIAKLLNQAKLNRDQLPIYHCNPEVYPDYIAMNTEPNKFHLTQMTAVGFYSYDNTFDRLDGLYNAIYYNERKLIKQYKNRYAAIPFVIAPDYSIFDDIWEYENLYRLFKIRILMLWFTLEMNAVVIPNAIYVTPNKMPLYYSGLEKCTIISFSTKGHVRRAENRNRVKEAVKFVTDTMPLKAILVYSACGDDRNSLRLFQYAVERGIDIIFVDNTLRRRNKVLMKRRTDNE